jgi:AhpD family alkylhydroperoxidase
MSQTPALVSYEQAGAEVRAVYDDIRHTRGTDFINNFWQALAHDPVLLKRTWTSVKQVMGEGALDPLTKELLYIAVSASNGCDYCIASHSAAARAKGLTRAQFMEMVGVIGMASETNRLATALRIPVDAAFSDIDWGD